MVNADGERLKQAITNILSNAIKYTPRGSITISLEQRSDRVELRVQDTGTGIGADEQKQLFAPFFRTKSADQSKTTGTGLGMWITKQLIEAMGGSIGVESIRGIGTHIVVTLQKS
jgi:signal transduction histidine kinase